jgi:hypothetical protein
MIKIITKLNIWAILKIKFSGSQISLNVEYVKLKIDIINGYK